HRTLALTHADFGRLLGNRQVREDADPDATGALHLAGDRAAGRFDLAGSDALGLLRLQAILAEVEVGATLGVAMDAALMRLAELGTFWLQHLFDAFSVRRGAVAVATAARTAVAVFTIRTLAALALATLATAFGRAALMRHRVVLEHFA